MSSDTGRDELNPEVLPLVCVVVVTISSPMEIPFPMTDSEPENLQPQLAVRLPRNI